MGVICLKYGHLIKPLLVQKGPEGLYSGERFWMFSKDLEGFNLHFSYGFIKETGTCHPVDAEFIIHPYDEILLFGPCDYSCDILDFDAVISVEIGEECEEQTFYEPAAIVIPKGVPHGPVKIKQLNKPIIHYLVGLAPEYKAETVPKKAEKTTGSKYAPLIRRFRQARILVSKKMPPPPWLKTPTFLGPGGIHTGSAWFFGEDLGGLSVNTEWAFYSGSGIWHRIGRHVHPVDEALIFVGLDPNDLNYLGAEIEVGMGDEDERHVFNKPTAVLAPKNLIHLPLITRWVDKPYGFIVLSLDADHETRWLQF
jgi:hypothetical protein